MKCGIVTVYRSENCGSFLQAFALSKAIEKINCDPVFVRHNFKDHSAAKRNYIKKLVKALLKGNVGGAKQLIERRRNFQEALRYLRFADKAESADCYVLGSDVIWDLTVPYFRNHRELFWGTAFKTSKVISYAPSVGFAKTDDLRDVDFVRGALKRMESVSVRDNSSKQLLTPHTDKNIAMVCDPTYLIDRAEYDAIAKPTELKKFLFLYYYEKMSPANQRAIQAFAEKEGLKIVTFGNYNAWCDIRLAYDPLLFLSIYDQADYIITNTFHGTVFATIYEKRFAVIKNDKPKILNLLETCAMSDKMTQTDEDISKVLKSEFDYDAVRQMIARERENGMNYLTKAIGEINQ